MIRTANVIFNNVTFWKVFTVDCAAWRIAQNWLLYAFTLHKFLVPKNTIFPVDSVNVNFSLRSDSSFSQRNERSLGIGLGCCSSDRMTCGKEEVMMCK